ncbi:hypothetical protein D3C74_306140 [compost metagenome]
MRTEVPVAVLPAHRGGVERGQQRDVPGRSTETRPGRQLGRAQHDPGAEPLELDLADVEGCDRCPRLPQVPPGPPLEVRQGRGPERLEPGPREPHARLGLVDLRDAAGQPVLDGPPQEAVGRPAAGRLAAHDPPLGRQQRQQGRGQRAPHVPGLGRGGQERGPQHGGPRRELRPGEGSVLGQGVVHLLLGGGEEGLGVLDGRVHGEGRELLQEAGPEPAPDGGARPRVDDRHHLARDDEQGPAHGQDPHEGATVVHRGLHVLDAQLGHAREDREVDAGRVGRVEGDEPVDDPLDRALRRGTGSPEVELVRDEPRPPLVVADPHACILPSRRAAVSAWTAPPHHGPAPRPQPPCPPLAPRRLPGFGRTLEP